MNDGNLLDQLRIEREHRDDEGAGSRWPWIVAAIVLLALAAGGWLWWSGARAVAVETVTASAPATAEAGAVLQATGYVTARRQATVSAQIVGTLTEVLIEEGDHVTKGQILARLEDSSQQARLDAAKANAQAAAARVNQVRTQWQQAARESRRQQDLVQRKLVSAQAAEQAHAQARALEAQLKSVEAQQKAARAEVEVAQVNYDYTVVRAPFAGVVTQKTAQVGEIIAPSAAGGGFTRTGVGTIVDMDSLEVEVDVNEAYIGRVQPDMAAEAVLDAYPDWTIPAHVIAIIPAADRAKATVKVRVALEQKDGRIVPNMGVRVSFLEDRPESGAAAKMPTGVLVPAAAIVERDGQTVVFVVKDGSAYARQVTPAAQRFGDLRLIPDGLAVGSEVVASPPDGLTDGTRVTVATR